MTVISDRQSDSHSTQLDLTTMCWFLEERKGIKSVKGRILVTVGAGFPGYRLCKRLLEDGDESL